MKILFSLALLAFGNLSTNEVDVESYLYRIVSPQEWQESQSQKQVVTTAFDKDFIHLSTEEQVPKTAQKFWNHKAYVVLKIDPKKLVGRLALESNPGGATLYYHLYDGKIPLDAVVEVQNKN